MSGAPSLSVSVVVWGCALVFAASALSVGPFTLPDDLVASDAISYMYDLHEKNQKTILEQFITATEDRLLDDANYCITVAGFAKNDVESLKWLNRAITADPNSGPANNNLGNELSKKGNITGALHHFQVAYATVPVDERPTNDHYFVYGSNMFNKLRTLKMQNEARHHAYEMYESLPLKVDVIHNVAIIEHDLKNFDAAEDYYVRVLSEDPVNIDALRNLAMLYSTAYNNTRDDDAVPIYEEILRLNPSDREAYVSLIGCFETLNMLNSTLTRKWVDQGVSRGVWPSRWQRPQFFFNGVAGDPKGWWDNPAQVYPEIVKSLEDNFEMIRDEFFSVYNPGREGFELQALHDSGNWTEYHIWTNAMINRRNAEGVPLTFGLVSQFIDATSQSWGNIKFSVLQPNTHIRAHCGPTNARWRAHLGISIPKTGVHIRIGDDMHEWVEGKVILFDDSYEHEVWNMSSEMRAILMVDIWPPVIPAHQRGSLVMNQKVRDAYNDLMAGTPKEYNTWENPDNEYQ